jgi:Ca2+-transporting ATPase
MFISSLMGLPVPLLPIQILWVNLVTDGLPALALGVDPVDRKIMKRPPRRTNEPVVDRRTAMLIGYQGLIIAVGCLFAFSFAYYLENRWSVLDLVRACVGLDFDQLRAMFTVPDAVREQVLGRARTIGFVVLAFSQDFHSYNCRSQTESLFKLGVFSNRFLVGATLVSMTLNGMAIYNPFFQRVLKTQPLLWSELALVVAVASMPLWVTEVVKAVTRSRRNKSA